MSYKVATHRKFDSGRYLLEIEADGEIYSFEWPANNTEQTAVAYEAQQLAEAKALLDAAAQNKGKKLKSEGTTL